MSQRTLSPQKFQEIRDLAAQWGKIVARRAFGEAGPGTEVDFQTLEQDAAAAAAGLTEGTLATLLEQQAQTLGTEAPCPDCGRPCLLDYEDRPLAVQGGQLTLHEPVGHGPDCRRDFCPPADRAASGQPRLPPDRVAADHGGRRTAALFRRRPRSPCTSPGSRSAPVTSNASPGRWAPN